MALQLDGRLSHPTAEAACGTALRMRRGCRSIAGHHPYQRNTVNVGSVALAPILCGGRAGRVNVT
jgi:hypothetical protein